MACQHGFKIVAAVSLEMGAKLLVKSYVNRKKI